MCASAFTWNNNGYPHNLWIANNGEAFLTCNVSPATGVLLSGGQSGAFVGTFSWQVDQSPGTRLVFACSVGNHCAQGMIIVFTVV